MSISRGPITEEQRARWRAALKADEANIVESIRILKDLDQLNLAALNSFSDDITGCQFLQDEFSRDQPPSLRDLAQKMMRNQSGRIADWIAVIQDFSEHFATRNDETLADLQDALSADLAAAEYHGDKRRRKKHRRGRRRRRQ